MAIGLMGFKQGQGSWNIIMEILIKGIGKEERGMGKGCILGKQGRSIMDSGVMIK